VHMVLKPMVVFTHGMLKNKLKNKKGEINYLFNKSLVFSNEHDFSCRTNGKVKKEKGVVRNNVWVKM
jgi:hypothetical protein